MLHEKGLLPTHPTTQPRHVKNRCHMQRLEIWYNIFWLHFLKISPETSSLNRHVQTLYIHFIRWVGNIAYIFHHHTLISIATLKGFILHVSDITKLSWAVFDLNPSQLPRLLAMTAGCSGGVKPYTVDLGVIKVIVLKKGFKKGPYVWIFKFVWS